MKQEKPFGHITTEGSLYIGDMEAEKHFLTRLRIKAAPRLSVFSLSAEKDTEPQEEITFTIQSTTFKDKDVKFKDERSITGTPSLVLMEAQYFMGLLPEEKEVLLSRTHYSEDNPSYLTFYQYSRKILNKNFKDLETMRPDNFSREKAREYQEAMLTYLDDNKYSDISVTRNKASCKDGMFMLSFDSLRDIFIDVYLDQNYYLIKADFKITLHPEEEEPQPLPAQPEQSIPDIPLSTLLSKVASVKSTPSSKTAKESGVRTFRARSKAGKLPK